MRYCNSMYVKTVPFSHDFCPILRKGVHSLVLYISSVHVVYSNFYLIFYPNFKISRKLDTQIWSKFGSFGYFYLIFHPNFWISKNLLSRFLDTQKFERKNIQNYQILTKFEYLIFWISKNLDKKLDKNLSKRHGRS